MAIPDLQTLPLRPPARLPRPAQQRHHRARPAGDRRRPLPGQAGPGDILEVSADIFKDGHDKIAAVVKYRRQDEDDWQRSGDAASSTTTAGPARSSSPTTPATVYTIEAFPDRWATWRDEVEKKFDAGQDVALELLEGPRHPRRGAAACRSGRPRGPGGGDRRDRRRRAPGGDRAPPPRAGGRGRHAPRPLPARRDRLRHASWRSSSTAPRLASPPGTRCSPARPGPIPTRERHLRRGRRRGCRPSPRWGSTSST